MNVKSHYLLLFFCIFPHLFVPLQHENEQAVLLGDSKIRHCRHDVHADSLRHLLRVVATDGYEYRLLHRLFSEFPVQLSDVVIFHLQGQAIMETTHQIYW